MKLVFRVVVLVLLMVLFTPGVASAHSPGGAVATNYQSTLVSFEPVVAGVSLSVREQGDKIQVTNTTATELNIPGYSGEPYLRVGKNGVYVNTNSPSYFTNRSRYGTDYVPPTADAATAPEWKKISSTGTTTWHDHRIHWVTKIDPPQVRANPGERHVVFDQWSVPMTYGDKTLVATGRLVWVPSPSIAPWVLIALMSFVLFVVFGISRFARVVIIAGICALVAIDIVHTLGIGLNIAGTVQDRLGKAASIFIPSMIAWLVGIYGAWRMWRCNDDGPWLVLFSAALIVILGGFSDQQSLMRSQVPFAWAPWLDRLAISLSIGMGLGLVVGLLVFLKRQRPDVGTLENESQPNLGGGG